MKLAPHCENNRYFTYSNQAIMQNDLFIQKSSLENTGHTLGRKHVLVFGSVFGTFVIKQFHFDKSIAVEELRYIERKDVPGILVTLIRCSIFKSKIFRQFGKLCPLVLYLEKVNLFCCKKLPS